jgi:hypothetical protein
MRRKNQDQLSDPHQKRFMKSWKSLVPFLGAGLLLILGAAAVFQFSKPGNTLEQNGAPNLNADVEEINLGDIPVGQTVQASFKITNTGNQPLKFSEAPYIEVKEGC